MNSVAFTHAARVSCNNMTKVAIYKALKKLSKMYPFDPKACGFVNIPKDDRCPAILPRFTWDVKNDRMRNTKGQIVKPREHFESVPFGMITCPWKGVFQWPVDVNDPSKGWIVDVNEEEEEGERWEVVVCF